MLRIGLSIGALLASLLFPTDRAVAMRSIYAYMTPCDSFGVGCDDPPPVTEDPPPTDDRESEEDPVYIPPPPQLEPIPIPVPLPYVPEIPLITPVHAAAPLHPAGIGMEMSLLLVILSSGISAVHQKCSSHSRKST